MKKEGLFYPTCLSVILGWGIFFASYELLARDAELTAARSREIITSVPGFRAKLAGPNDKLADVELTEHRRKQDMDRLEEAERTTRLAAMASAAIAAAAGVVVFTVVKPPRQKRAG